MPRIISLALILTLCQQIYAQTVKLDSSNLPICIIDTRGKTIANEPKITAYMKIIYNGPGKINHIKDKALNYNNFIGIEIRGNSSQFYPQKQYGLELHDSITGADLKAPIMGMPEEEDWILYAPYNDISLLRNVMTYQLWNQMGHWGPRTKFCELIINNDYVGVYIMMESIKRGQNRVDVSKLKPEDTIGLNLTGGYIMKVDKQNATTDLSFISKVKSTDNRDITWLYHYPDSKDIQSQQKQYIQKYIDTVEQLIASNKFADPISGYRKYLSVQSFIDYFLIQEFSRNIDAYKASSYFYKEKLDSSGNKGQFKAGPVWDYNFAFGNASFCSGAQTNGWMYDGCVPATLPTPAIWKKLLTDSNYTNDLKCRYLELRKTILDTAYLYQFLNKYAFDTLSDAQKRHYTRWKILGTNPGGFNAYIASSYNDELSRLKTWIRNRLAWMDANLPGRCINPPSIAKIEAPLDPDCYKGIRAKVTLNQVFSQAPFNYSGMEKIKSVPNDIIRWVLLELRDAKDSTKLIDTRAALLRSDSVIVDTNLMPGVFFPKAIYNTAYSLLVRYDAFSYVYAKNKIVIPNNNDYNLNHASQITKIAGSSPLIYSNPVFGKTLFEICLGQNLILNDSSLGKAGYNLKDLTITSVVVTSFSIEENNLKLQFDTEGTKLVELYMECNNNIIKTQFTVKVNPLPTPIINGQKQKCPDESIVLTTNNYNSYSWSTGETSKDISIKNPGLYKLTVTDINGCSAITEISISNFPTIEGTISASQGNMPGTCKYVFKAKNNNSNYKLKWESGELTDSIQSPQKQIKLIVTDENGCTKEFTQSCIPLSGKDNLNDDWVFIQPNPNEGNFIIHLYLGNAELSIYNISGQTLFSRYYQSDQLVQFENWKPGIYFIRTTYGKKIILKRLIVQ